MTSRKLIEVRLTRSKAGREHFVAQFEMKKLGEKTKKYLIVFVVSAILSVVLLFFSGIINVQKLKNEFYHNKGYGDESFDPEDFSKYWEELMEYPDSNICDVSIRVIN